MLLHCRQLAGCSFRQPNDGHCRRSLASSCSSRARSFTSRPPSAPRPALQRPRPVVHSTRVPQVAEKDEQQLATEQEHQQVHQQQQQQQAAPQNGQQPLQQQLVAEKGLVEVERIIERETRGEQLAALVGAAVAFGGGVWYVQGAEKAQEYFAGYLLEQSLSIDNLFVFILVFNYFQTPPDLQSKVLTYGLATAAILRAVMIILGVELIQQFEPLLLLFAAILLYSSVQLLVESGDDEEDLSNNKLVQLCQTLIPVSATYDGDNFFTVENGVRTATPLLLVLAIIELSDVVFAVDSIPAVFGVTLDPFIVYSSNIFAIISLRSLYSFVSSMMTELRFLDKAVALVLGFIGFKMIGDFSGIKVPTDVSLLVVASVLGGGIGLSLLLPEREDAEP